MVLTGPLLMGHRLGETASADGHASLRRRSRLRHRRRQPRIEAKPPYYRR